MRNATLKASVSALTPKILEISMSLASPVTRETRVRPLTVARARSNGQCVDNLELNGVRFAIVPPLCQHTRSVRFAADHETGILWLIPNKPATGHVNRPCATHTTRRSVRACALP